jgi:hypothetical protein
MDGGQTDKKTKLQDFALGGFSEEEVVVVVDDEED